MSIAKVNMCTRCDPASNGDLELVKEIRRRNGEVLMEAMKKFEGPVKLHEVALAIARSQKVVLQIINKV